MIYSLLQVGILLAFSFLQKRRSKMKYKKNGKRLLFTAAFLMLSLSLQGKGVPDKEEILVASGGGYKKPVTKIGTLFSEETGIGFNGIYGNMQAMTLQVRESGQIGIIIGDRKFLDNKENGLEFTEYLPLGKGQLVLAWRKGLDLNSIEDLKTSTIERISYPDPKKAIFGKAADEFLTGKGLKEGLEEKMIIASTVPQVSSYLISGEVDGGFINLTDTLAIKDQIGGYMILESGYGEIEIVAGVVKGFEEDPTVTRFLEYLAGEKATEVFQSYGF
jgi:molybdate transport system substrate-binding protein